VGKPEINTVLVSPVTLPGELAAGKHP
jgi:hypothetical protein